MRDESFIPFYLKPNKQRITREEPQICFPNYMNGESQNPKQKRKNPHLFNSTYQIPKQITSRRCTHPVPWDRNGTSNNYKALDSVQMAKQPMASSLPDSDRKEAYYQQIRQELDEMKFYQSRRPFKPTKTPSIWKSGNGHSKRASASLSSAAADNSSSYAHTFTREMGKHVVDYKKAENKATVKSESLQGHKKNHLNRGLEAIMDQERSISVGRAFVGSNKSSNHRRQKQAHHTPFLDKQQTNGEKT